MKSPVLLVNVVLAKNFRSSKGGLKAGVKNLALVDADTEFAQFYCSREHQWIQCS